MKRRGHCSLYYTQRPLDLIFTIFLFRLLESSWSILIDRVEVPKHPVVGGREDLICHFELEKGRDGREEKLYSVKWYKDGNEFYRYLTMSNIINCVLT